MRKLLVICGPTACGKTSLALHLSDGLTSLEEAGRQKESEESLCEIVSADSRQVYKSMDIGTGKDVPPGFVFEKSNINYRGQAVGYYTNGVDRIWCYDVIEAIEPYSVASYIGLARRIVRDIWKRGKIPIVVGGTGFYIKGLIYGIPTSGIPQNMKVRKQLVNKSPEELFEILSVADPLKAGSMNASDRGNPRRLVRAIEIARSTKITKDGGLKNVDALFIGLVTNMHEIETRISKRVNKRMKQGLENEIMDLFKNGVTWDHQSMQSLGYKQWRGYFKSQKTKDEVLEDWKIAEKRYARRQITWFKKEKNIKWFDVSSKKWQEGVEKEAYKWYKSK